MCHFFNFQAFWRDERQAPWGWASGCGWEVAGIGCHREVFVPLHINVDVVAHRGCRDVVVACAILSLLNNAEEVMRVVPTNGWLIFIFDEM